MLLGAAPRRLIRLAVVSGLALAASCSAIAGDFLSDDTMLVTADAGSPWAAVTRRFWEAEGGMRGSEVYRHVYRPVVQLFFALETNLFGASPLGFHLVNILVHAATSCLVLRWLERRLGGEETPARTWTALCGAAWFAVHPLHAESASWISGATDLWMAFFWLLALDLFERPTTLRLVLGALALASAVLSKEVAVVAPVLLAIDAWAFRAPRMRTLVAACAAVGAAALLIYWVAWNPGENAATTGTLPLAWRNVPALLGFYLLKSLIPSHLTFQWKAFQGGTGLESELACGIAGSLVLLWLGAVFAVSMRRPALRPGVADTLWFVVPLLPAALALETTVSDRFAYVPVLGIVAIASRGLLRALNAAAAGVRVAGGTVAFVTVFVCLVLHVRASQCFASATVLAESQIEAYPQCANSYQTLGVESAAKRDFPAAQDAYERAADLAARAGDRSLLVQATVSLALLRAGALPEWDPAVSEMRERCVLLLRAGRLRDPRAQGPQEITLSQAEKGWLTNDVELVLVPCARAMLAAQDFSAALEISQHALTLLSASAAAIEVHVLALARMGRFAEARAAMRRVNSARSAALLRGLAERVSTAQQLFERASKTDLRQRALLTAQAFAVLGALASARQSLNVALEAAPTDHDLVHMLAQTFVSEGRFYEAQRAVEGAARLQPADPYWEQVLAALRDAAAQAPRGPQ